MTFRMLSVSFAAWGLLAVCSGGRALSSSSQEGAADSGHVATEMELDRPHGLAIATSGILYVSTFRDGQIHRLLPCKRGFQFPGV